MTNPKMMIPSTKSKRSNGNVPAGLRDIWKLWRHCLCRHGTYPLLVAPFISMACLLDLYSSISCEFMRVNVGFVPVNDAWTEPVADVGFWYYQSGNSEVYDSPNFIPGCQKYSEEFTEYFFVEDRAWSAARIMAKCSGIAGLIAFSVIWIITICPIPASFIWPGVLLPAVLVGFLGGGAKFFLLDSQLCRSKIWLEGPDEEMYERAESCTLQKGAYFAIASIATFFFSLCLIFYRVPELRHLDPNFGNQIYRDLFDDDSKAQSKDTGDIGMQEASPISDQEDRNEEISPRLHTSEIMIGEDDGVEAVMGQINDFFKANGGYDCESNSPVLGENSNFVTPSRSMKTVGYVTPLRNEKPIDRAKSVDFDFATRSPHRKPPLITSGLKSGSLLESSRQYLKNKISMGNNEEEGESKFCPSKCDSDSKKSTESTRSRHSNGVPCYIKAKKMDCSVKTPSTQSNKSGCESRCDEDSLDESVLNKILSPAGNLYRKETGRGDTSYRAY